MSESERLERIESKLDEVLENQRRILEQEIQMAQTIDQEISDLQAQVASLTTVEDSADALLNGINAKLAAAAAAALTAGATPAQLKAVTDVNAALKAGSDKLAAAVAANT